MHIVYTPGEIDLTLSDKQSLYYSWCQQTLSTCMFVYVCVACVWVRKGSESDVGYAHLVYDVYEFCLEWKFSAVYVYDWNKYSY